MRGVRRGLTGLVVIGLALIVIPSTATAQQLGPDDRGVAKKTKGVAPGFTLLAPLEQQYTYLVDNDGRVVHQWRASTRPGLAQQLTPKGELVRAGNLERRGTFATGQGAGGRIEALSWSGDTLWQHDFADNDQMQHHDIEVMPNGHVLAIVWERKTTEEAIAAGRDPDLLPDDELWPDKVVEYDPATDSVVWEWHAWDHLVQEFDDTKPSYVDDVKDRPERIDLNYVLNDENGEADWNHLNGVDYNPELDQIVLSSRSFSEFWIIDHSTTTEEAGGPQGDLLFRYGNPKAYDGSGPRTLFFQHDVGWIDAGLPGAGHLLLFNNGAPKIRTFSSADEVVPTMDASGDYVRDEEHGGFKARIKRVFPQQDEGRFAAIVSGAERLPNGNTAITYGNLGHITEVSPKGAVVWEYENPYLAIRPTTPGRTGAGFRIYPNWTFKTAKYPPDYPAFAGKDAQLYPEDD
jgi:Arylsulfotransferase (ASST)